MEGKILGVRFKRTGKLHYMDPLQFGFKLRDMVLANSERGLELGRVVSIKDKTEIDEKQEIAKIIKPATKYDLIKEKENVERAKEALKKCKEMATSLNLNMKLIHAEYIFDNSKIIFYFVSEERVDFRELVKGLASEFRTRIELKQVGPRDEIKVYPNLGMCGREVCCRTFLPDFETVTIKMAKEQGLQINMPKISGACGRLMCCLKYEEDIYKENLKEMPKSNEIIQYGGQPAKVIGTDVLNKKVKLRIGNGEDDSFKTVSVSEIIRNNDKRKE